MLPKKNRLTRRSDFASVYAKGSYFTHGPVSIKFLRNGLSNTRIGFSVGKNYSAKATERNRMRRILRAACLSHLEKIVPGYDIVIMAKPANKGPDTTEYSSLLGKNFKRSSLMKGTVKKKKKKQ